VGVAGVNKMRAKARFVVTSGLFIGDSSAKLVNWSTAGIAYHFILDVLEEALEHVGILSEAFLALFLP
jgi:hypothetical protein